MTKSKVLITQSILYNGIDILEKAGLEVEIWQEKGPIPYESLLKAAADKVGIISMLSDKIDSKLLDSCPHLTVVSNYAVGFNNIDVEAASKKGIAIGNTPGVLTDATADLAMALLLNLSRRISPAKENVINGAWINWEPKGFLGKSLKGKTLGVYGLGRIGQAFAKRCVEGFGMRLIHCSRSEKPMGQKVELDQLLKESDVISLHCPLTEQTKNLFDYDKLKKMKKDCLLINTARGEVIVQDDLEKVISEGHFFGVGLDVTSPEPLGAQSPLLKHERVLITPHIGSADYETRAAMSELVARNIISALNKAPLPGFVNPDIWDN